MAAHRRCRALLILMIVWMARDAGAKRCTFEEGACDFYQDGQHGGWSIERSSSPENNGTGDHTSGRGWYLVSRRSDSRLISPPLANAGPHCLSWWFTGQSILSVSHVLSNGTEQLIWVSVPDENAWQQGQVLLRSGVKSFLFNSQSTWLALDDIDWTRADKCGEGLSRTKRSSYAARRLDLGHPLTAAKPAAPKALLGTRLGAQQKMGSLVDGSILGQAKSASSLTMGNTLGAAPKPQQKLGSKPPACDPSSCPKSTLTPCQLNGHQCIHTCRDVTVDGVIRDWACECLPGFQLGADSRTCNDVDECLGAPCESDEWCINAVGSFICVKLGECPLKKKK